MFNLDLMIQYIEHRNIIKLYKITNEHFNFTDIRYVYGIENNFHEKIQIIYCS